MIMERHLKLDHPGIYQSCQSLAHFVMTDSN
jgi:hypothetical protein